MPSGSGWPTSSSAGRSTGWTAVKTYMNCITAKTPEGARIALMAATDREALDVALACCLGVDGAGRPGSPGSSTRSTSAGSTRATPLLPELEATAAARSMAEPAPIGFDADGPLTDPWPSDRIVPTGRRPVPIERTPCRLPPGRRLPAWPAAGRPIFVFAGPGLQRDRLAHQGPRLERAGRRRRLRAPCRLPRWRCPVRRTGPAATPASAPKQAHPDRPRSRDVRGDRVVLPVALSFLPAGRGQHALVDVAA